MDGVSEEYNNLKELYIPKIGMPIIDNPEWNDNFRFLYKHLDNIKMAISTFISQCPMEFQSNLLPHSLMFFCQNRKKFLKSQQLSENFVGRSYGFLTKNFKIKYMTSSYQALKKLNSKLLKNALK